MIVSDIRESARIESLHPLFKTVFDYVKSHDLLNEPCGRIELDGDRLFINNVNPECVKAEQQVLEVHHQYIDIHILLEGEETIGWKPIEDCSNPHKALRRRSRLRSLHRACIRLRKASSWSVHDSLA